MFIYLIAGAFIGWFILNSIFESRFIRLIGRIQILFTIVLVAILIYNSESLGWYEFLEPFGDTFDHQSARRKFAVCTFD